jgi:hypothetical protein
VVKRLDFTGDLARAAMGIMPHKDIWAVIESKGLDKERHF